MLSSAQPRFKPSTRCPYCAHVSPDDSKFCNECGAALHLAPCPHCGAVNDVSLMDVCARCNGDLRPTAEPAPEELGKAEQAGQAEAPEKTEAPDESVVTALFAEPPLRAPAVKARPWPLLLGVAMLMVGASVAAYIGYQQRSAPSAKSVAITDVVAPEARKVQPATAPDSPAERPLPTRSVDVTATAFAPKPVPPVPRLKPPNKVVITRPPAESARTATRNAVTPPPPTIGPCTDAVAALGLCNSGADSTPRRP